jgi:hypothetical protein
MLHPMKVLLPLLLAAPLSIACQPAGSRLETVSDDPVVQAKLETARTVLAEILTYKLKGKSVYADCKTAEMLFYKELRNHRKAPAAKKLLDDLEEACKNAQP